MTESLCQCGHYEREHTSICDVLACPCRQFRCYLAASSSNRLALVRAQLKQLGVVEVVVPIDRHVRVDRVLARCPLCELALTEDGPSRWSCPVHRDHG